MNTVLKNSLITGLLFIAPQLTNADDSEKPNSALGDVKKQPINKAQYVIAPASPYYTVTEPDKSKVLEHLAVGPKTLPLSVANSSPLDANELENIIRELKIELESNEKQTASLFEQLHATAAAADFDNEMYSKTFVLQQKEIEKLKQESLDLRSLKMAYTERDNQLVKLNDEINSLKEKAKVQIDAITASDLEVKTLREAYAVKIEEAQALNAKLISYEQIQEELVDLQNESIETNEDNALLKTKLIELDALNVSLNSQLSEMKLNSEQQTIKLGLLNQASGELDSVQSDNQKLKLEVSALKGKLLETEGANKALSSEVGLLKSESNNKIGLLSDTSEELASLNSIYNERNEEASNLKEELLETEDSKQLLLAEIEKLRAKSNDAAKKALLLDQSSVELNALKSTYQEKNDEAALLKEKLITAEEANESLVAQTVTLQAALDQNLEKLKLFDQNSADLEALSRSYKEQNDQVVKLKEMHLEIENKNKSLIEKIDILESKSNEYITKLGLLDQTTEELKTLKESYAVRNDEALLLGEQKGQLEEANSILIARIDGLNKDANANTEKLGLLNQASSDLSALKDAYKEKDDALTLLTEQKTQLEEANEILISRVDDLKKEADGALLLLTEQKIQLEEANEILISRIDGFNKDADIHAEKLGLLDKTSAELSALHNAYKEKDGALLLLTEQKTQLEEANKILISRIDGLNKDADINTEKLGLLEQTSIDLTALKDAYKKRDNEALLITEQKVELETAYKAKEDELVLLKEETAKLEAVYAEKNNEFILLKEQKVQLEEANDILISRIDGLNKDASINTEKLALLDQTSTDLNTLKGTYKERNDEVILLKEQKIQLEEANGVLTSKIDVLNKDASINSKKLGILDKTSADLNALKKAYAERTDEVESLKSELAGLTTNNKSLLSQLDAMKLTAGENTKKLGLLAESSSALDALKLSFKDRNDENIDLKEKLSSLNITKDGLVEELNKLKSMNLASEEKLTADAAELETTNKALTDSKAELSELNEKLVESESLRETLTSEIANLHGVSKELDDLKKSIKALEAEKLAISNEFAEALKDNDKDGVVNKLDKCPSSALNSSVDSTGCIEIADKDGDRVADADDLCPNTSPNTKVNTFGCNVDESITLKGVNFTSGSDRLTNSSLSIINSAAATLKQNSSINIEVSGHTDSLGDAGVNQQLSLRRANSVAEQLIAQGVARSRVTTKGYGESQPIASNDTQAGRTTNRRVELRIR